jgi:hypothetical protein
VVLLAFDQAEVPRGTGHQTENNNRKANLENCIRSNLKVCRSGKKVLTGELILVWEEGEDKC